MRKAINSPQTNYLYSPGDYNISYYYELAIKGSSLNQTARKLRMCNTSLRNYLIKNSPETMELFRVNGQARRAHRAGVNQ